MTTSSKTILIIEDDRKIAQSLSETLGKALYTPIILNSPEEAHAYINSLLTGNASSIACIIFDYVLDSKTLQTSIPLITKLKRIKSFTGIMFANARDDIGLRHLLAVGCTHSRKGIDKKEAAEQVIKLLE